MTRSSKPKPSKVAEAAPLLRDAAGIFVASVVVLAFTSIGFLTMSATVFLGVEVTPPDSWMSAMLSIASVGLGFLLKQKMDQGGVPAPAPTSNEPSYTQEDLDTAYKAKTCNCPICFNTVDCDLVEEYERQHNRGPATRPAAGEVMP